jgi:AmmeMemoRadiSam system protein A
VSSDLRLGPEDRRLLLHVARLAIREHFASDGRLDRELASIEPGPELLRPRGAFVTLRNDGILRGCVGRLEPEAALLQQVVELAERAALHDPRFPPLAADELAHVLVHVSVLGPLLEIATPADIHIGRHGVEMSDGAQRAVFLPEVAPAQGWDVPRLLEQLARKAGIDPDRAASTRLRVFETVQFGEG